MINKNKLVNLMMIVVLAFAVTALASTSITVKTVTIKVGGMNCQMCAASLEPELKATKSVIDARVSFKKKNAWIKYDEKKVTVAQLRKVINDAGFTAR